MCGGRLTGIQRRFCSKQCNDRWRSTVPSRSFTCAECGSTVLIPANKGSGRKYCTRSCATAAYNTRNLRGERNGNWRGGHALYYGRDWKKIKAEVRARDGVCSTCGMSADDNGRELDVHHVNPFRFSGDNSLDNLVALCRSCHMRADDHGRSGAAQFLRNEMPKRPTKREIRRLRQLLHEAERRALRRQHQRTALAMNEDGSSLREIAQALGVSHQTVFNWLRGNHRVNEPAQRYLAHSRQRPLRSRLLSCPSLSAR